MTKRILSLCLVLVLLLGVLAGCSKSETKTDRYRPGRADRRRDGNHVAVHLSAAVF